MTHVIVSGAGGGSGIRTHDTVAHIAVFKTAAIDHSATPPLKNYTYIFRIFLERNPQDWRKTHAAVFRTTSRPIISSKNLSTRNRSRSKFNLF